MKTTYNILKKLTIASMMMFAIISCDNEDYLIFTAINEEEVKIQNEFLPVYKLSEQTKSNVMERFVWNEPDFGAPSTITYVFEVSTSSNFSSIDLSSGDISDNNFALSVKSAWDLATSIGLDDDPSTNASDGSPNNSGVLYARVKAFAGTSSTGANSSSTTSKISSVNIEIIEKSLDCEEALISSFGLVGSGTKNGWDGPDESLYKIGDNLFLGAATLSDGVMKIREDNDWAVNYGTGSGGVGTLTLGGFGNDIPTTSGNYIITVDLANLTYEFKSTDLFGIIGDAAPGGWGSSNDVKLLPDPCANDKYIAQNVPLTKGVIKIRQNNDWGVNYGTGSGGEGTLTLGGFGNDIPVSEAGTYDIEVDLSALTYTLTKK